MSAVVEADIIIVTAPEKRMGRRAGDPTEREFAYAVARGDDGTRHELFAFTPTAMAALGKLGKGDPASARGEIAVKSVAGAAVIMINIRAIALRLPGFPTTAPTTEAKCSTGTKATRMATRAGVEAADRKFAQQNTTAHNCAQQANSVT
jgi:hypothetical protein